MKKILMAWALCLSFTQSYTQTEQKKVVGGGCEGCSLYIEGMPKTLSWQTIIAQDEKGTKIQISTKMNTILMILYSMTTRI